MGKRQGYISWDDYFMGIALLSAQRSKDPGLRTGACLVSADRKIVGIGYNGFPLQCPDDALPWEGAEQIAAAAAGGAMVMGEDMLATKYPYVCHAELNAIVNSHMTDLRGCEMYVTTFPCNECAKLIIQSRIRRLKYLDDPHHDDPVWVAARRLFALAKVHCTPVRPQRPLITLTLQPPLPSPAKRPMGEASGFTLDLRSATDWRVAAGAAAAGAALAALYLCASTLLRRPP